MRVLVCGGAGYIGTHFVRTLLRDTSHDVIILDSLQGTNGHFGHVETRENRSRRRADVGTGTDAQCPVCDAREDVTARHALLEVGDVRDVGFLDSVFTKHAPIDAVVHMCASLVVAESVADPLKYYDNNVIGIIRLLQAMRRHGCGMLIFSSSAAVFGSPLAVPGSATTNGAVSTLPTLPDAQKSPESPYGETKLAAEWLIRDCTRAYGIRAVCLRYFNACGAHEDGDIGSVCDPPTHLISVVLQVAQATVVNKLRAERNKPAVADHVSIFGVDYPTPDGTCVRDYVHVVDLASAHVLALDYLSRIKADDPERFFALNLGTSRGYSVKEVIEVARRVTGRAIPVRECGRRPGDPAYLVASCGLAQELLGWRPRYDSLEKIIESAWKFHRAHPMGYDM
ncbi:RmlD substrate binding domain [Trypanosoma vivax]|uniref:UDP-glucose 4-epimerase n=1 Tax=Trypanosoma vivax (strain Y486) TaxID=1055687 RepID=G0UAG2_TRYVY|nr:putative UDP-galactose 4-epimerase [Trypanosoma vivax]KAH8617863.1 RmlD substrate binding domain [Trypanosoma vivax]KAH8617952.1 RmlD substrate binding domain [Trypanosoma vivax]CCC52795.1 putative UDP-galactose 4-epimerase [Trypanosoma vivax Y486]